MPVLAEFDADSLGGIASKQIGVISRSQALRCRMSTSALRHRIRADGPWQVVLPGVYATSQGMLTDKQRAVAAFLYAGRAIAVTGQAALGWHGIPAPKTEFVDVLVAHTCQRVDTAFVRPHRTRVAPESCYQDGLIRYAYPARAVADTIRELARIEDVRALVAAGVQRGKVEIWQLEHELRTGPARRSGQLRHALAEVADGVRSIAEGDLPLLIKKEHLPVPLYNPRLYVGGEFLASPDAWWQDFAVAAESDSKAYHLSPAEWEQTLARQARMVAEGILVLSLPPSRIRAEGWKVAREIRSALDRSRGPLEHVTTVQSG